MLISPVLRPIRRRLSWMARRAPGKSRLFAVHTLMRRISPRPDGRRGVGDPLAHRQRGGRSAQNRARGQRKHDDQSVPYAARIARVGHLGQTLQQARDLAGYGPGMLAELVKGKRDRR